MPYIMDEKVIAYQNSLGTTGENNFKNGLLDSSAQRRADII